MPADASLTPPAPTDDDFLSLLHEQVTERIDAIRSGVTHAGTEATTLAALVGTLMTGGKRMRARLAFSAWYGYLSTPPARVQADIVTLGAALELFQAAALLHDDIIDRSETRRGAPSAHVTLRTDHGNQGGTGDSDHFGIAGAILAGDLALVAADDAAAHARALLSRTEANAEKTSEQSGQQSSQQFNQQSADRAPELSAAGALELMERAERLRALWRDMGIGVTAGQFLDLHSQSIPTWGDVPDQDRRRAFDVIVAKSARYSVEFPLLLGATLAGATPTEVDKLARVGRPLGIAFQLRDDVLGVFGDPVVTGKPAGDDIREGKRTVLLTETLMHASAADAEKLTRLVRTGIDDPDQIAWVTSLMIHTGARERLENIISDHLDQSLTALADCALRPAVAAQLRDLAIANVSRNA